YRIVDEVVRKLALYLQPEDPDDTPLFAGFNLADRFAPGRYELHLDNVRQHWTLQSADGAYVERGAASDSVGGKVGFLWVLPNTAFHGAGVRKVRFTVATPREATVKLLERMGNRLQPGSNFLWLTLQDPDPRVAARTLNTWLAEFIQVAADLKK